MEREEEEDGLVRLRFAGFAASFEAFSLTRRGHCAPSHPLSSHTGNKRENDVEKLGQSDRTAQLREDA